MPSRASGYRGLRGFRSPPAGGERERARGQGGRLREGAAFELPGVRDGVKIRDPSNC